MVLEEDKQKKKEHTKILLGAAPGGKACWSKICFLDELSTMAG